MAFAQNLWPEGSTFQVNDTTYAMLPHLLQKLPWDHDKDLVPVTTLALTPLVVLVGANAPYKTALAFIDFARKNPDKANDGSGGVGSSSHLGASCSSKVASCASPTSLTRGRAMPSVA